MSPIVHGQIKTLPFQEKIACGAEALCRRRAKGPAEAERNQENLPRQEKCPHYGREK